ncbi:LuxR C-terminal-related transcriptional regulator, partial [Streptomyces sp. NPDC047072]|uniref:helix-turn-helix transcriptional regulator n=1 Tax=Streptomyces sp. NPDC047072 TaxID=3154809 RepID=UPI0033E70BCA
TRAIAAADVRDVPTPTGEWLLDEGHGVPARHAAVRARFARLRGELREAAAWAREGLRESGDDPSCRHELALAAAQSGASEWVGEADAARKDTLAALAADPADARPTKSSAESDNPHPVTRTRRPSGAADSREIAGGSAATWWAAARGDLDAVLDTVAEEPYDAVRLGVPERAADRLTGVFAAHARALAEGDGPGLDRAAHALEARGFLLFAAEAHAHAVRVHRDPSAARTARTRAVALARRCQGARTPALSGLVLGELTARQRQIVTLAAAGLSNRQIAEKLTLSVRTVGNHLYSAYARLGASDRGALPWLVELPEPEVQPA